MIVHDQDANRCSSFPSTGNSIWKIAPGWPGSTHTLLQDAERSAPTETGEEPETVLLLLLQRRGEIRKGRGLESLPPLRRHVGSHLQTLTAAQMIREPADASGIKT
jgi:hypothetical protein